MIYAQKRRKEITSLLSHPKFSCTDKYPNNEHKALIVTLKYVRCQDVAWRLSDVRVLTTQWRGIQDNYKLEYCVGDQKLHRKGRSELYSYMSDDDDDDDDGDGGGGHGGGNM
ncbi:hypothetical protein E2C01_050403 [Portunus trituberculatus]|uniref:Uncharacterized protein n=1 Tax=Portunus trituberculatus TaxID=210409 RepID=A0A5B7GC02_PORTR|nr:hypothetical protein [Portunus trituberculatus]